MKHASNLELRTAFYSTWARGVLSPAKIASFTAICGPFSELLTRLKCMDSAQLSSSVVRRIALPLCYDLSGIVAASKSYFVADKAFVIVFQWLHEHLDTFENILNVWYNDAEGSVAVLNLYQALVTHTAKPFASGKPDSLILFQSICRGLTVYCKNLLNDDSAVSEMYSERCIAILFL